MNRRRLALTLGPLFSLALFGCGDSESESGIGQAGDKARATRTLEIRQLDALRFEPASLDVKPGETVTLRVTNSGTLIHEFFLGTQKEHDAHDDEMKAMSSAPMNMKDMANTITVDPGASEELTWTFPQKGTVQYGCHQPGHYGDGMRGTVKVA